MDKINLKRNDVVIVEWHDTFFPNNLNTTLGFVIELTHDQIELAQTLDKNRNPENIINVLVEDINKLVKF